MAPEESAEAAGLLQSFESRYLAARTLRSFPWQSLEEKLRDSSGPELLLIILQKVRIRITGSHHQLPDLPMRT
uniref:FAM86 N-terminal domain-containing protein n=1 Tax=Canis lupus dingo TaxID=286419 RepID=A0A8C0LLC2_CANLU